jgi:hypothetical protein
VVSACMQQCLVPLQRDLDNLDTPRQSGRIDPKVPVASARAPCAMLRGADQSLARAMVVPHAPEHVRQRALSSSPAVPAQFILRIHITRNPPASAPTPRADHPHPPPTPRPLSAPRRLPSLMASHFNSCRFMDNGKPCRLLFEYKPKAHRQSRINPRHRLCYH